MPKLSAIADLGLPLDNEIITTASYAAPMRLSRQQVVMYIRLIFIWRGTWGSTSGYENPPIIPWVFIGQSAY